MKNRVKLTDKEIAIGMWTYIKLCILNHDKNPIALIKYVYLSTHHMIGKWPNFCILCHKHDEKCSECPLCSCSIYHKTPWSTVTDCVFTRNPITNAKKSEITLQERLEACDKIIEAIEKDIPDDYKS